MASSTFAQSRYNQRKNRKGAFWEDRYHATAVQKDSHLIRCMVYIHLNMIRAGVVEHPSQWPFCGHNEIRNPPGRYSLIDRPRLMRLLGMDDSDQLSETYERWTKDALGRNGHFRDGKWSESIAVGTKSFVEKTKERCGIRALGRQVVKTSDVYELKEPSVLTVAFLIPKRSL